MKKIFIILLLLFTACTMNENVRKDNVIDVQGMYLYYRGNSELIRCDNNQRIFIKGGKAWKDLEKQYNQLNLEEGEKVYVEVKGKYELIEVGAYGSALVFFVDEVYVIDENKQCGDIE